MYLKNSVKTTAEKETLLANISKLHTTHLGIERIKRNLHLDNIDIVEFCKSEISSPACAVSRRGKNWYCRTRCIIFTINAQSYTIITAKTLSYYKIFT